MGTASNDTRKQQFRNFLQADSATDEWFDELTQDDTKDWDSIETAFRKRWPRKKAVKKTAEEYEEEITGLKLKMEDLGKKEKTAGREVYSHIVWADKMLTIIRGAKLETTTTYIGHVRKDLPKLLREKVGAGHRDWTAFLKAIRDVDIDHIRDGVDIWKKEQEEQNTLKKRVQQLEKLTASPTAPLRHQMTTFGIGNTQQNAPQLQKQTAPTPQGYPFTGTQGEAATSLLPKTTDLYPHKKTGLHCSRISRNIRNSQTQRPVGKRTKRSRQIGQKTMEQTQ